MKFTSPKGSRQINYRIAVMAVVAPNIIPGTLQTIMGQSFTVFDDPYKVHAAQLIAVITGKIKDPV